MTIIIHEPPSREEWLKLRLNDVTASEIGSLFNTGYMSRYELWHIKSGHNPAFIDTERMRWGRRLEKAIAEGICEDLGLELEPRPVQYFSNTETRMGATPDFFITCPKRGKGILQIKNVDFFIYKEKWTKPDDGGEAPDYIEMQIQQEMLLTGVTWGLIGVLVGGNDTYVYERKFYPEVASSLEKHVSDFWKSIEDKQEPQPDFKRDADFISELYSHKKAGKTLDMTGDEKMDELFAGFLDWRDKEKEAEDMKDSYKAEMLTIIKDAETVSLTSGKIVAKEVKETKGTLITPEMVGTFYGARKSYPTFNVKINKENTDE